MKSEPDVYGFDDLERDGRTPWDGIRNYQARNFLRDEAKVGDAVLFYHSNVDTPGIVGLAEVVSEPYADPTQFDPSSKYHDPASDRDAPRWVLVDVAPVRRLERTVTLAEMKIDPILVDLPLVRRGNRLSIMPVTSEQTEHILALARRPGGRTS